MRSRSAAVRRQSRPFVVTNSTQPILLSKSVFAESSNDLRDHVLLWSLESNEWSKFLRRVEDHQTITRLRLTRTL
jgi:hypothetical protein